MTVIFSLTHINDVEGFVSKYSQLLNIIVKFKINLQECVELIKVIKRVISVEGDWIEIKLMEILGNWNVMIKPTYENLTNSLKTYKIEMSKPLVDEIKFLSQIKLPKDVLIKELVSELEIHWAGNKLKNCLNNPGQNYIERIKSGEVKVIIISTPNSISALELHVKTDDIKYEEKQLLSICNKQSSHYHRIIADIVKAELNSNLLKTQYNKRLDLYRDVSLLNRGLLVSAEDKKVDGDVGEVLLREVVLQNPEVVIEVNDEDIF